MGMGDMTLMAFVGAAVGPELALLTIFVGAAIGAIAFVLVVFPISRIRRAGVAAPGSAMAAAVGPADFYERVTDGVHAWQQRERLRAGSAD